MKGKRFRLIFSGRRIARGLYRGKTGCIINADINGTANIIRKYRADVDFSALDQAVVLNPSRVRVLRTPRRKPHLPVVPGKSKAAAKATHRGHCEPIRVRLWNPPDLSVGRKSTYSQYIWAVTMTS